MFFLFLKYKFYIVGLVIKHIFYYDYKFINHNWYMIIMIKVLFDRSWYTLQKLMAGVYTSRDIHLLHSCCSVIDRGDERHDKSAGWASFLEIDHNLWFFWFIQWAKLFINAIINIFFCKNINSICHGKGGKTETWVIGNNWELSWATRLVFSVLNKVMVLEHLRESLFGESFE